MQVKLKDVLHLYIGATILLPDKSIATLIGIVDDIVHFVSDEHNKYGFCSYDSPCKKITQMV
jgi:hypothetical protein